jgi:serine protease Do
MAKDIMAQLREKGSVTRGWLGVQIQPLTPELRESLGLAAEGGALIAGVIKGDPAEKAGLKAGDVVVEFDGRAVRSDRDLVSIVGGTPVGRKVTLKVVRDGKSLTIEVKIAKRSDEKDEAAADESEEPAGKETGKARIGVQVQDVTRDLAEQLGLEDTAGALVTEVIEDSPAERAGIERGDVILEANRQPVENAAAFVRVVRAAAPGKSVLLLVRSGRGTRYVPVKLEAAK